MRVARGIVRELLIDIFVSVPLSLIFAGLVWFFGSVIAGANVDYWSWTRWSYIVFLGICVAHIALNLLYLLHVSRRLGVSFGELYVAVNDYELKRSDLRDSDSYHSSFASKMMARNIAETVVKSLRPDRY